MYIKPQDVQFLRKFYSPIATHQLLEFSSIMASIIARRLVAATRLPSARHHMSLGEQAGIFARQMRRDGVLFGTFTGFVALFGFVAYTVSVAKMHIGRLA